VVLFLKLPDGAKLSSELERRIKAQIRQSLSARHVPAKVHNAPSYRTVSRSAVHTGD
jgi:acetoacetyl-CoA synthetase